MPEDYEVQLGDCMSSIAYAHGFFWQTLWTDGSNSDLKSKRKNPNVLLAGDIVHIPDLTVKQESGTTEQRHNFMLKGVPEKLRIKLLDSNRKPRANLDYIIVIDGDARRGKTNGKGELKESIPPNAKAGELRLGKAQSEVIKLNLGHLAPVSEMSGVKARLANLGFYRGALDGKEDAATAKAISAFQEKQGSQATGKLDDATRQQILQVHGH